MAITRRQFIKRTSLATAGAFLGPSLFRNPFLRRAVADQLDALDRYLVIIFLDGGNDGLNTVTPLADGTAGQLRYWYEQARSVPTPANGGGLQLATSDLQATQIGKDPHTATPLALHPGLVGLWNVWKLHNAMAVIQGCGDPNSLNFLSHEFSRSVWSSGNPFSNPAYLGGWVGRYLGASYGASDIPAVCIGGSIARELQTSKSSVLAMYALADFGFPYDDWDGDTMYGPNQLTELQLKHDAFSSLYTKATSFAQPAFKYIGTAGSATLTASDSYPPVDGFYTGNVTPSDPYSPDPHDSDYQALIDNGNGFAADLREVAKVIFGVKNGVSNVKARAFEVSNGGYDTHSDQGTSNANDQQYGLHRAVGDALDVFYQDCLDMGVANKLLVMVWSEFSRRILQNSSGTDHGSQGPVFVIGGTVKGGPNASNGGVYGNHPNINSDPNVTNSYGGNGALNDDGNTPFTQAAQNPNDPSSPARSTDIRDVYGTILKHWLNISDPTTLLPVDTVPNGDDPNQYWTVPNFDLPFLP
jgi:uncharacterized protein (DUF1501 family)